VPGAEIRPAAPDRWPDIEHALTGGGDGASCWCQYFMVTRKDFDSIGRDGKRDRLRAQVEAGPTGLIGYLDGNPAGWVRASPRIEQPGVLRTRLVRAGSAEPPEAEDVWAITCLVVRREYRGRGLAHELVAAAVDFARRGGARLLEAYPRDTADGRASSNSLYVGTIGLFERQGFEVVARPTPSRAVMTRQLASDARR
jgi:ribosomal protein S18 acetylase RimI-like enzyme